jgi:hypothetical protein
MIRSTTPTTNKIQEICVATAAIPDKPRAAATTPSSKNINAEYNM